MENAKSEEAPPFRAGNVSAGGLEATEIAKRQVHILEGSGQVEWTGSSGLRVGRQICRHGTPIKEDAS